MPRPASGYKNAAGIQIPGTSDITGRFMDRSRLIYWAHSRGKQGLKLYDEAALNIGTAVHMMAELDLRGSSDRDIEFYVETTLRDPDERAKAVAAFGAFRQWRDDFAVTAHVQEVSLVSEALQYGGTLDTVATIRNGLGLVDFKTTNSGEVYADHVLQLAAYGILWNETHPKEPLASGYHLILLPKSGATPIHREFTDEQMQPFRQLFWCYRRAYDYDVACSRSEALQGCEVKPSKPKAPRKPKAPTIPPRPATMAEILRTYGHLSQAEVRA